MLRVEFATLSSLATGFDTGGQPLVVMPFIDPVAARRSAIQLARRAGCQGLLLAIFDDSRDGFVAVANRAFAASTSPLVAYVAQDAFAGRGWLGIAARHFNSTKAGLIAFNDGKWNGELAAFGMARRDWAARNYDGAPLFYPGYRRHFADTELTVLALAQGALAYDPAAVLVEVDWEKDAAAADATDRELFAARASNGFGGVVSDPRLLRRFS